VERGMNFALLMKYEHLLHKRQCWLMLHIVHLYPKCTERM